MNKNIKIAKELVRIAKSLVAMDNVSVDEMIDETESKLSSIQGIDSAELVSVDSQNDYTKAIFSLKSYGMEFFIRMDFSQKVYVSLLKNKDDDPITDSLIGSSKEYDNAIEFACGYAKMAVSDLKSEEEQKKRGKEYDIDWDGRGNEIECWVKLYGARDEEKSIQSEIIRKFSDLGVYKGFLNDARFKKYGYTRLEDSLYDEEPLKSIVSFLEQKGFKKRQ